MLHTLLYFISNFDNQFLTTTASISRDPNRLRNNDYLLLTMIYYWLLYFGLIVRRIRLDCRKFLYIFHFTGSKETKIASKQLIFVCVIFYGYHASMHDAVILLNILSTMCVAWDVIQENSYTCMLTHFKV